MATNKLTRLKHLNELATRTKAELNKLDAKIQDIVTVGGEPNVIDTIKVNGVAQAVVDKTVDITITHPEYSIVKAEDSGDFAAVYNLTKDGVNIGAAINIPKDIVVKSGSVVGDEIVLVLNDDDNTEIKIPVGSLIEYVTSGSQTGDMVYITVDESTHKVTATITDGTITLAKLESSVQTAIGQAHSHSFSDEAALNGITAAKVAAWDAAEQNAKNDTANKLKDYSTTDDMNAAIKVVDDKFVNYTNTEGMNAAIKVVDDKFANYSNTEQMNAAIKVVNDKFANYTDTEGMNAAIKAVDDKFASYTNTEGMNAAIKAVDDKFVNYYTSTQIDGMIATDAEVTAALDEVFGSQEA